MQLCRQCIASELVSAHRPVMREARLPRRNSEEFGRALVRSTVAQSSSTVRLSDDFKLFATTFAAGFIFVSLLIA